MLLTVDTVSSTWVTLASNLFVQYLRGRAVLSAHLSLQLSKFTWCNHQVGGWGENRLSQFLCWCLLLQGGDIGKSGSLVLQAIPCCLAQGSFAPPLSGSAAHLHLPIQSLSSAGVALQEIFCNNNFWQNFKCVFGAAGRLTAEALWQDDCWLIGWRGNAPQKVFPQMKPSDQQLSLAASLYWIVT